MLYILHIIARQNIFEFSLSVIHTTNHCMTKYIWVVNIMLYILQIIAWQNIFEFSLSVIHTTNHCMTKYIWVVIIMLYILQIIAWQNIFELSLLCYTYYKSLHDKIYLSCHYYVIHTTNHCMTKYIWVVKILCYIYYKSLHDKIYFDYYVIHTTNHCMTKYIWVVIIMLYILQIIVWQNIFELSILCYTYYKSLHDKIYLSCQYYVMHTTNHCMTKYIWVVIISYRYYKALHDKIYLSCQYYVMHTTNHCMTKYIWVVIIMLYIIQIIAWQNIFELSILCYTYYKSLHDKIYLSFHYL